MRYAIIGGVTGHFQCACAFRLNVLLIFFSLLSHVAYACCHSVRARAPLSVCVCVSVKASQYTV